MVSNVGHQTNVHIRQTLFNMNCMQQSETKRQGSADEASKGAAADTPSIRSHTIPWRTIVTDPHMGEWHHFRVKPIFLQAARKHRRLHAQPQVLALFGPVLQQSPVFSLFVFACRDSVGLPRMQKEQFHAE